MSIGIIGAGNIGAAFALVACSSQRFRHNRQQPRPGPAGSPLNSRRIDQRAPSKTRRSADMVLVAGPRSSRRLAPDWNGRIVIDANNPIEAPLFKPAELNGRLSSEIFADLVPGARVVKAFNHLLANLVSGDPQSEGGKRVLFYSGDDAGAKAEVGALIDKLGFFGIDLGSHRRRRQAGSVSRRPAAGAEPRQVLLSISSSVEQKPPQSC